MQVLEVNASLSDNFWQIPLSLRAEARLGHRSDSALRAFVAWEERRLGDAPHGAGRAERRSSHARVDFRPPLRARKSPGFLI